MKEEKLNDHLLNLYGFIILLFFAWVFSLGLILYATVNLQENINSLPHYDCRNETISGFVNLNETTICDESAGLLSSPIKGVCIFTKEIARVRIPLTDLDCIGDQCYYKFEKEICEIK